MRPEHTQPLFGKPARRGAAMVMVTVALGLATAMSVALLVVNSSRAQNASAAVNATVARYLAESGANISMFYLQYPDRYSGEKPKGFYPGEESVNLGAGVPGTINTYVEYDSDAQIYAVRATAQVTASASNSFTRNIDARLVVFNGTTPIETPSAALITNNATTLTPNTTINGSVQSLGAVTVAGTVTGDVASDTITLSGSGNVVGQRLSLADGILKSADAEAVADRATVREGLTSLVPEFSSLTDYRSYEGLNALGVKVTCSAAKLTSSSYNNATFNGTLLNPKGVYWIDTDLEIQGDTTFNGTLILRGGRLRIRNGSILRIKPAPGFPALVSDRAIRMDDKSQLHADGLVYAQRIESTVTGATGAVNVNGAMLLFDATKPLPTASEYTGSITVNYDKSKATVSGIGSTRSAALSRGVRIVAWSD